MALYERERHITELKRQFLKVLTGKRQVAIINGPVGSGKTELLRAFAEGAVRDKALHLGAVASRAEQRMPTAVLRQLVRAAEFPPDVTESVDDLLRALCAGPATEHPADPGAVYLLHNLGATLLDALEHAGRPLVISVDDVHYADTPSLQCLALLLRRLQQIPVLLVLTEAPRLSTAAQLFKTEFPLEFISRISLGPLSRKGVAAVLREHLGAAYARDVAPRWHAVSGGNPLMLQALLEDRRTDAGDRPAEDREPVVGMAYHHALLSCLHRSDRVVLDAARALAVLGEDTDVHLVAKLIGTSAEPAQRAMGALEQIGVVTGNHFFRHPQAREAVLGDIPPALLDELHRLAGRLLYTNGADAATIAEQVVAVEGDEPAAVPLLHEGAKQALAEGNVASAINFLRRAHQLDVSDVETAATSSLLARAEWRVAPETAVRRLPALRRAAGAGHLALEDCLNPIGLLLWGGDPSGAMELWRDAVRRAAPSRHESASLSLNLYIMLSCLYPAEAAALEAAAPGGTEDAAAEAPDPLLQDYLRLCQALREGPGDQSAGFAEKCLHDYPLRESSIGLVVLALVVLIVNGRLSLAKRWAEELRDDAEAQGATSWAAFLRALEAAVTLHLGDPATAANYARTALTSLSTRGWGVAVGVPLSVLIQAYTSLDRLQDARACLQIPVPGAMFQTPMGLLYRHARGLYHYASGRYEAALDDFRSVGELTQQWGLDLPGLVSWRSNAAWSSLALGRVPVAIAYAEGQLDRSLSGDCRARAASLRVLAAVENDPVRALQLLEQAVELLERGEETLELAHALTDLGRSLQRENQEIPAKIALERAERLAARGNVRRLGRDHTSVGQAPAAGGRQLPALADERRPHRAEPAPPELLSKAERRVAVLAAHGMSNRQISRKLYITISTVEQHLTRIYRKLNVTRRDELALQPLVVGHDETEEPLRLKASPQTHAS
jgi:DNA-binding CsgD family transcriptional regulator